MTLRVERRHDDESGIRLIGRIRSEHLPAIQNELERHPNRVTIDLSEVTNLDVDAVRFLSARESEGYELLQCSLFIREWIDRERETEPR